MEAQLPTIRRIVNYIGGGEPGIEVGVFPALITATALERPKELEGNFVHLTVFEPNQPPYSLMNVAMSGPSGELEQGTWCWPDFPVDSPDAGGEPEASEAPEVEEADEPEAPKDITEILPGLRDGLDKQNAEEAELAEAIDVFLSKRG